LVERISDDRSTTWKLSTPIELNDWAVIPSEDHFAVLVR